MDGASDSDGWVPYGPGPVPRSGVWQRVLDVLNARNVQHNYDGFGSLERAEAAVVAMQAAGIPGRATLTDSGPVVIVVGRFRRRAEPLLAPFQTEQ